MSQPPSNLGSSASLAKYIDHTLLRPEAAREEIVRVCSEAKEFEFAGVCVELKWLPVVVSELKGSKVLAVTVISFPAGTDAPQSKARQAKEAVEVGANEIDMVLNRGLLHQKDYAAVFNDIAGVVEAASGTPVKVILETSELTSDEKKIACSLAKAAGAKFVKTSTGFSKSGATAQDVKLMREVVGPEMGVKASGGIRSYADAIKMVEAGATRLGTSASVAIVKATESSHGGY